jgi:iron complex outermembrane receptor protein
MLEEVVVTAQKREQSLQDVGISVTAFTGDQMNALGFTNTVDIALQTPGFTVQAFNPTFTYLNIRGISQNDFGDHLEAPVAFYSDEAYVSAMSGANVAMFDIERAEVLRGPQGTLFGRNATGGLIHFISNKPTDEFEGYIDLTVAEHEQLRVEAAVNVPITDSIRTRLSVSSNQHDGTLENRIGDDKMEADSLAVRGQIAIDATEDVALWLKLQYGKDDTVGWSYTHDPSTYGEDGLGTMIGREETGVFFDFLGGSFTTCPGCDAFGYRNPSNDVRKGAFEQKGTIEREIQGATGKLNWSINDSLELTSITDYLTIDKDYIEDSEGSPIFQVDFEANLDDLTQVSQELRLNGEGERHRWVAGLYYLDIEAETVSDVPEDLSPFYGAPIGSVIFLPRQESTIDSESWAIFGHLEYDISEHWRAIGAVRYTEDERDLDWEMSDNFGTLEVLNSNTAFSTFFDPETDEEVFIEQPTGPAEQSWENYSIKAQIDWLPNDDWLIYAGYNRGHKAGNFSTPYSGPILDFTSLPHDEEVLNSFEAGFKATILEGKGRLNASVFYYDYEDYQAAFFEQLVQRIRNLDATAYGGEVEFIVNPAEGWDIVLGMAAMDSEVEDVGLPNGTTADNDLPGAPNLTVNGLVRYAWPAMGGEIALQGDFNYSDEFCFTVVCDHTVEEDSYVVGNLRASYTADSDRWSVSAFVQNVGDEEYRTNALDVSVVGFTQSVYGPPRWYGVTLGYRWF